MASLTQWTWVWANSRIQWRTGKPGTLHSMGLQRVGHDLATEQQMETLIRCGLWVQGGMNRESKEDLKMVKYMLPYDTSCYTFVQIHRMYNSKLECHLWFLCLLYINILSSVMSNMAFWLGMLITGKTACVRHAVYKKYIFSICCKV